MPEYSKIVCASAQFECDITVSPDGKKALVTITPSLDSYTGSMKKSYVVQELKQMSLEAVARKYCCNINLLKIVGKITNGNTMEVERRDCFSLGLDPDKTVFVPRAEATVPCRRDM